VWDKSGERKPIEPWRNRDIVVMNDDELTRAEHEGDMMKVIIEKCGGCERESDEREKCALGHRMVVNA